MYQILETKEIFSGVPIHKHESLIVDDFLLFDEPVINFKKRVKLTGDLNRFSRVVKVNESCYADRHINDDAIPF